MSLEERFKQKVLPVSCGCHLWLGCVDRGGYGFFRHQKKNLKAHRVAYKLHYGFLPQDTLVCHTCDNPSCVNPEHLFVGSNQDNQRDAVSKGRHRSGSVVTQEIADEIRQLKSFGSSQASLAKKFNLSDAAVSRIVNRKRW